MFLDDCNQFVQSGQLEDSEESSNPHDIQREEPSIYLTRPGFFAHLWRDPDATIAWRNRGSDLSYLTDQIVVAQVGGDALKIEDAIAAKNDLCRELAIKHGRVIRQRCYNTDDLLPVLRYIDASTDNWISQNVFRRRRRRVIDLRSIGSAFADLDFYKTEKYRDRSPDFVARALRLFCYDNDLLPPSVVIDSGRGLQVKWILDRALPARALPRWRAVQRVIGERLVEFGADPNARDASRVLRLPGRLIQSVDGWRRSSIMITSGATTLISCAMKYSRSRAMSLPT